MGGHTSSAGVSSLQLCRGGSLLLYTTHAIQPPICPPLACNASNPTAVIPPTRQHCYVQVGLEVRVQAETRVVVNQLSLRPPAPLIWNSEGGIVDCLLLELKVVAPHIHPQVQHHQGRTVGIVGSCRCC